MNNLPKISAVMCTYGRFSFVERTINFFLAQSYPNKELIVYNTDTSSPYNILQQEMGENKVFFFNCSIDRETNLPYTNVGAIRRDALRHADGDYTITYDDDDVFMPWFMQQGMDRIQATGRPFFKPAMSMFYASDGVRLVRNTMEASVIGCIKKVREYGYLLETGKEGLGWYTKARDAKELDENDMYFIPSYCFDWKTNPTGEYQHRQSGNIDCPNNFETHKSKCTDRVNGRDIRVWSNLERLVSYEPFTKFIFDTRENYPSELYDKYFKAAMY